MAGMWIQGTVIVRATKYLRFSAQDPESESGCLAQGDQPVKSLPPESPRAALHADNQSRLAARLGLAFCPTKVVEIEQYFRPAHR